MPVHWLLCEDVGVGMQRGQGERGGRGMWGAEFSWTETKSRWKLLTPAPRKASFLLSPTRLWEATVSRFRVYTVCTHARWCKSEPTASAAPRGGAIESLVAICCHTDFPLKLYCSFVLTCITIQPSKSHDQDCHTCGIYFYCQKQDTSWVKLSLFQKYNKLRSKEYYKAPR